MGTDPEKFIPTRKPLGRSKPRLCMAGYQTKRGIISEEIMNSEGARGFYPVILYTNA